jgi:hypothetical protein
MFSTIFLLICTSLQLKVIPFGNCPDSNTNPQIPQDIRGCTISGDTTLQISGNGNIIIQDSIFVGFAQTVLKLNPSGYILLAGLKFNGLNQYGSYAIVLIAATECMVRNSEFTDFTNAGVINSIDTGDGSKKMLTLYDLTIQDVKQADDLGIIRSSFDYLYGEGLTFISCSGAGAFQFPWNDGQVPVFSQLLMDSCNYKWGISYGLQTSYFVISGGTLINTQDSFASHARMYYEGVNFTATNGFTKDAIVSNGAISVIGCSFSGYHVAITHIMTNILSLFCASTFEKCGKCVYLQQESVLFMNCIFKSYTSAAIHSLNGKEEFQVKNCLFISDVAPAIINEKTMKITGSCFSQNGETIRQISGAILIVGDGCCFKQAQSQAINGGTVTGSTGFNCDTGCIEISVNQVLSVCNGYAFSPRPTPLPTRTAIVPWKPDKTNALIPIKTQSLVQETTTLKTISPVACTDQFTLNPTLSHSPFPSFSQSPQATPSDLFTASEWLPPTFSFIKSSLLPPNPCIFSTSPFFSTSSFIQTLGFKPTMTFSHFSSFSSTSPFIGSNSFQPSVTFQGTSGLRSTFGFSESHVLNSTKSFLHSTIFSSSPIFTVSNAFTESDQLISLDIFTTSVEFVSSHSLIKSNSFDPSNDFTISNGIISSNEFSVSKSFAFSASFPKTLNFTASNEFSVSKSFEFSVSFPTTLNFTASNEFTHSHEFTDSQFFDPSISFIESLKLTHSNEFTGSQFFDASISFLESLKFTLSKEFIPSIEFNSSNSFEPSESFVAISKFFQSDDFIPSPTFTTSIMFSALDVLTTSAQFTSNPNEQMKNGLPLSGALAAGAAGLTILAALAIFLLVKRTKKNPPQPEEETIERVTETTEDENEYISEYGLSDAICSADHHEADIDFPQTALRTEDYENDFENASECNPEELDDEIVDVDEA